MDWIEQAVFTSAENDRASGYQVVATSPGVCEADVRELAVWGPSHDALLESVPNAVSLNFHPLPSGAYCAGRTTPAGWEYSGRGGARIYTQCLIVPPKVLKQFANNPFALLRAALAGGSLRVYDEVPKRLEPLRLAGGAGTVDTTLLARLCTNPGPRWLVALVQAALNPGQIAIAGGPPAELMINGLINCLPLECRTEFSFSTGLKFSARRPFRVVALTGDKGERRRVRRLYDLTVLDLSAGPPAELAPIDSWPRFIGRVLKSGRTSFLAAQLSQPRPEFAPQDLPALGLQLLEELDASSIHNRPADDPWPGEPPAGTVAGSKPFAGLEGVPASPPPVDRPPARQAAPSDDVQRAHEAHRRFQKVARSSSALKCRAAAPSAQLEAESPEVLAMLEKLDDLVYDAIAGKAASMEQLKLFWPQVRRELGEPMFAESREQYLRYALSIWEGGVEPGNVRRCSRAVQALDVLCLLFEDES